MRGQIHNLPPFSWETSDKRQKKKRNRTDFAPFSFDELQLIMLRYLTFSAEDVMTIFKKEHIVLLESIGSNVQILMESVIALGHKLDAIGAKKGGR
jgi:hypothetical protein